MTTIRQLHILWTMFKWEFASLDRPYVINANRPPLRTGTGHPIAERIGRAAAKHTQA